MKTGRRAGRAFGSDLQAVHLLAEREIQQAQDACQNEGKRACNDPPEANGSFHRSLQKAEEWLMKLILWVFIFGPQRDKKHRFSPFIK